MIDQSLSKRSVLVVEHNYMLAIDVANELEDHGAMVIGPVGTLEDAVDAIKGGSHIDAVLLDVNLRGELAFPAADLLLTRGVPFVFTTGYEQAAVPIRFAHVERCEKPADMKRVAQTIARALHR